MTISEVTKPNPLAQQAKQLADKARQLRLRARQQRAAERVRTSQQQLAKAVVNQSQAMRQR
jgi:hypothetical protein